MKMQTCNDVWDALSDMPEEAENMKIRSGLMMAISDRLENLDGTRRPKQRDWASASPA